MAAPTPAPERGSAPAHSHATATPQEQSVLEDVALHRDVDPLYPSFASKGPPTAEDEADVML